MARPRKPAEPNAARDAGCSRSPGASSASRRSRPGTGTGWISTMSPSGPSAPRSRTPSRRAPRGRGNRSH
ncbi:MAG: hypothetical protein JKP98_13300 [Rhodobacteraceae bacterium]|nr:hypothetical protein [Paracoccaceae bacterium]